MTALAITIAVTFVGALAFLAGLVCAMLAPTPDDEPEQLPRHVTGRRQILYALGDDETPPAPVWGASGDDERWP